MKASLWSLLLALVPWHRVAQTVPGAQAGPEKTEFLCPPCGAECHFTVYPKAGSCGGCGMALVPLASVPQVGVLLHPDVDLASSLGVLAAFASSNVVRAFTVADTTEPLRLSDTLEVRPQFALAQAPRLDVLVVPQGHGAWDDALIVEWVKAAAAEARCVIAVGRGSIVLARAGYLAGEQVPADRQLAERGKELAPEPIFDATLAYRRADRFFLARDAHAALDASLAVIAELAGAERAKRTAATLGHPWAAEQK